MSIFFGMALIFKTTLGTAPKLQGECPRVPQSAQKNFGPLELLRSASNWAKIKIIDENRRKSTKIDLGHRGRGPIFWGIFNFGNSRSRKLHNRSPPNCCGTWFTSYITCKTCFAALELLCELFFRAVNFFLTEMFQNPWFFGPPSEIQRDTILILQKD